MLQIFRTFISKHTSMITMYICIGTDQLTIQKINYEIRTTAYYSKRQTPVVDRTNPHKFSINNRFMSLAMQQKRPYSKAKHESKINN